MASEAASARSGNDAPGRHPLHPRGCGCSRGHRAPCRPASDSAFYLEDLSPLQVRGQRHLQSPGCPAGLSPRTCCGECGGSPRSPLPLGIPCIPQGPPTSLDTPGQCVWWVGAGVQREGGIRPPPLALSPAQPSGALRVQPPRPWVFCAPQGTRQDPPCGGCVCSMGSPAA